MRAFYAGNKHNSLHAEPMVANIVDAAVPAALFAKENSSMRMVVLAAAAAILSAANAQADPFEGIYGNTATSTAPNGKTTIYYFNRDGTFENHLASGRVIKGTFTWKDAETACFTVTDPPPKAGESSSSCRSFPVTHHVGDTWVEKDSEGVTYTNAITLGRQRTLE